MPIIKSDQIPLSLYVHLPWCEKKCPYCDFNSHTRYHDSFFEEYINLLILELETWSLVFIKRGISTIYFGGGTPNLFPLVLIKKILDKVTKYLKADNDTEITFEMNPGNSELANTSRYYLNGLKKCGVNRISVGVQSFNNQCLEAIGRTHDSKDIYFFLNELFDVFPNVNIDLMFGLPGQTKKMLESDLNSLSNFSPTHISYYQLTIEPNTLFYTKRPKLPSEEAIWGMQELIKNFLIFDYRKYEISAYKKNNFSCCHNLNYWRFGDYIGIGAGAHSKISRLGFVERRSNISNPELYMQKMRLKNETHYNVKMPAGEELLFEYILNITRLREGFLKSDFEIRTGLKFNNYEAKFISAIERGLLKQCEKRFYPTELGFNYLTDLQSLFLPK